MTLKQLQAEWHKRADGYEVDGAFLIHQCEEDLAPFILQQERDMKLILDLVSAYEDACNGYMDNANSDNLIEKARSRLKEMDSPEAPRD